MAKEAGSPIGVQEKRKQKEKSLRKQNKGRRGQGDEDEIKAFQNSSEAAIENGFVGKVVSEKKGDEAPSKKVGVKLKEEPLPPNLDDSDGIKIEELAPEPGDIDAKAAKQPEIVLEREKEDPPKDIKNKEENTPEQPQENKEGENVLTQREFNQKYPDILRRNRFSKADEKKDWIYIIEYDEKTGQVEIGESGKKSKKVALKELDDFLSRYPYYGTETKDAGTKEKRKFLKIEPAPAAVSDNKKEKKKKEYNKETKEKNDSNDKKNETHKKHDNHKENQGKKETNNEGGNNNKEKGKKNENAGNSEARGIEKESKDKEETLRQEMETARKEYLEADYRTNSALGRIRKYFGIAMRNEKEKLPEIEGLKSAYEKKLFDLFEHKIQNAKYKGADEKELAKLFREFKIVQRIELAEMHDLVKAEQVYGTNFGKIKEGLTKVVESYQKWPLKYKLAFGAVCFGAGALAGGITAVGAALIVKRGFSGIAGAFGMKRMLDVGDRKLYERKIEKETQVMEENLKDKKGDEKYNDLLCKLKEMSSDDKLKNIKNWQRGKMTASIMAGIALGGGGSYLAGALNGEVPDADNIHGMNSSTANSIKIENLFSHGGTVSVDNLHGTMPGAGHIENLTIEKGSSIEGTLIKQLKELGVENPGAKAHNMFLNYMQENKASIIDKVGIEEYQKMLKDGMVNIKAGTGLEITSDGKGGFKLSDIKGVISHIDTSHADASNVHLDNVGAENANLENIAQQDIANEMKSYGNDIQSQIDNYEHVDYIDLEKDKIENARLWELLKEKSFLSDMVNPDTKEIVSATKNNIFGKSAKVFLSLKNENLAEIIQSEETKEAFLKKIPKSGRVFFNELVKQVPPKSGDTTLKWLVRVAVEIKKIKSA